MSKNEASAKSINQWNKLLFASNASKSLKKLINVLWNDGERIPSNTPTRRYECAAWFTCIKHENFLGSKKEHPVQWKEKKVYKKISVQIISSSCILTAIHCCAVKVSVSKSAQGKCKESSGRPNERS